MQDITAEVKPPLVVDTAPVSEIMIAWQYRKALTAEDQNNTTRSQHAIEGADSHICPTAMGERQ